MGRSLNCSRCGKPRDGSHQSYCLVCQAEYTRNRRAADPEGARLRQRQWQQANRDKMKKYKRRFVIKQYGLTELQLLAMQTAQGGRCANLGCEVVMTEANGNVKDGTTMHIDHDHETNTVRGLLCSNCNLALGLLKDDPERIMGLIDYLSDHAMTQLKEA